MAATAVAADVAATAVAAVGSAAVARAPATIQATNMHHAAHVRHKDVAATVADLTVEMVAVIHRDQLKGNLIQCAPAWT